MSFPNQLWRGYQFWISINLVHVDLEHFLSLNRGSLGHGHVHSFGALALDTLLFNSFILSFFTWITILLIIWCIGNNFLYPISWKLLEVNQSFVDEFFKCFWFFFFLNEAFAHSLIDKELIFKTLLNTSWCILLFSSFDTFKLSWNLQNISLNYLWNTIRWLKYLTFYLRNRSHWWTKVL